MNAARRAILEDIVKLYHKSTPKENISTIIESHYDEQSQFKDPFFDVTGREKVKTQFVAMYEYFDTYQLNNVKFDEVSDEQVNIVAEGEYVIKGKNIKLDQETRIYFNSSNKVTFHNDHFRGTVFESMETTPVIKQLFTGWRKATGLVGDQILSRTVSKE